MNALTIILVLETSVSEVFANTNTPMSAESQT